MSDVIRANPGFWFHFVPGTYNSVFECFCSPIIAWRKTADGDYYTPITIDGEHPKAPYWDHAIEYPDGTCVNDSGKRYATVDAWSEGAERAFYEHCAELSENES
jgi:hypothetical protein